MLPANYKKLYFIYKKKYLKHSKALLWFLTGICLGLFFLVGFAFTLFRQFHKNSIYPGITVANAEFGGKTREEVKDYFANKNGRIEDAKLVFKSGESVATISAKDIGFGYDDKLIAEQAWSIGRGDNIFSNTTLIIQAYINGLNIPASYRFNEDELARRLSPLVQSINTPAEDAVFSFENGKVVAFRLSKNGQEVNLDELKADLKQKAYYVINGPKEEYVVVNVPVQVIEPKITSDSVNKLGIKELIGEGSSLFQHSIPNRIYNLTLASTRINGSLVAPGETFSFNKIVGDVSAFTGYKQAYVIQNGRTVLGDGGGLCQVSTTLFRAALNAGLPVIERHAHSYRVGYYEQDSGPGIDATVYEPSIDFKFKNDTKNHILIQYVIDPTIQKLTFQLYGASDGRVANVGKPVITSESSAPEASYQDDPSLPKGTVQQVDFSAPGATVYFTRSVVKDGKEIINEKYNSRYQPWRAVFLRGTKE